MERIQLRRDLSTKWTEINPILMEGEVGFETDTKLRKIGDGVTAWNNLDYLAAENIVQELGNSENTVISQKISSDNFLHIDDSMKSIFGVSKLETPDYTITNEKAVDRNGNEVSSSPYSLSSYIKLNKGDAVTVGIDYSTAELASTSVSVIAIYDIKQNYIGNVIGGISRAYYTALKDCYIRITAYTARWTGGLSITIYHSNTVSSLTINTNIKFDTILGVDSTIVDKDNLSLDSSYIPSLIKEEYCLNYNNAESDINNLSLEKPLIYNVEDPDYSITDQFSNINTIVSVTDSFVGFPTSIVYNNKLYCFYYKSLNHTSTPGRHDNMYYKVSTDNGITWSSEREWVLPNSDSAGLYRSYRTAYMTLYNDNIMCGIFVTTTNSSIQRGSFTMLCEISIDENDNIIIKNNIKVPIVIDNELIYSYKDQDITNSMIIGGNIVKVSNDYFIGSYDSNNTFYVLKFNGDFSSNTNINILDSKLSTNRFILSEHTFIKFDDNNLYLLLRDDKSRIGSFIYKYNNINSTFDFLYIIEGTNFNGQDSIKVSNDVCVIFGRNVTAVNYPCKFSLMNKSGKIYKDNATFYKYTESNDTAYCSLQIIGDKLFNIFYIKTDNTNSYSIVQNTIETNTLTNLIYY